jgi:hypothetical protein
MQLPPDGFDPDTVAMMGRVCDEAWREAERRLSLTSAADTSGLRDVVALRVMAAVANGERDQIRLKAIALDALDA